MCGRNGRFLLRSLCVFWVGLCSLPLLAQTPATGEASQPTPANETVSPQSLHPLANSNGKLGIGDLIEISVFGVPDLSSKTRISGSGDVYLPLIDYVHVAGLTTDEAQELIEKYNALHKQDRFSSREFACFALTLEPEKYGPGEFYKYSTLGYLLASLMLEKASGLSYAQLLAKTDMPFCQLHQNLRIFI